MPNAYVVSAVTRKPLKSATPDSNNDDSSSPQYNNSGTMQWGGGTTSVYTLANGEQRRRTELPDRCKRLDILARHGLISSATSLHKSKRGAAGAGAGGAYADDAFEGSDNDNQHDDDDYGSDEFEGRSPSPQNRNSSKQNNSHEGGDEGAGAAGKFQQCAAVGWSMVKRQVSNDLVTVEKPLLLIHAVLQCGCISSTSIAAAFAAVIVVPVCKA
jgi:hypothetical protein